MKTIREQRGYTREELANKASISSKFLFEVENDLKGISAVRLAQLAKALQVSADYLMEGVSRREYEREALELTMSLSDRNLQLIIKILKLLIDFE